MRSTERGAAVVLGRLLAAARTLTGATYVALVPEPVPGAPEATTASGRRPRTPGAPLARPVRVGGRVVAQLEVHGGRPGPGLEEVAEALAGAAGLVLVGDRTEGRSEERLRWLEASARLTEVFAPPLDLGSAFGEVVRMGRELSGAVGVALVRRKGEVVQPLAVVGQRWSAFEPLLAGTRWVRDGGVGAVPELLRVAAAPAPASSTGSSPAPSTAPSTAPPTGPVLLAVAPMRSEVKGAAALLATFDRSPDPEAVGLLCAFAGQAAFAFDRAQAGEADGALRALTERERVARDLHDQVMQRLFGIGLQVQVARDGVAEPAVRARLEDVAAELDRTVGAIRSTIFALRREGRGLDEEPTGEPSEEP